MELAADGADQLDEATLDRHVHVLVAGLDRERVLVDLAADRREPALDFREVLGGDDVAACRIID